MPGGTLGGKAGEGASGGGAGGLGGEGGGGDGGGPGQSGSSSFLPENMKLRPLSPVIPLIGSGCCWHLTLYARSTFFTFT
jgi:hypothetical protein